MKKVVVLICILILCFCFVACSSIKSHTFTSFEYFNTLVSFTAQYDKYTDASEAWSEMLMSLGTLEDTLSVYKEGSDIDDFNNASAGTKLEITPLTYRVLTYAKEVYENTNGAYNPALFPLSDLWGFTDRFVNGTYTPQKPYDREKPFEQLPDET